MLLPYRERRQLLESLKLSGPAWSTAPVYDDGAFLFEQVCERGLEGIVAKRLDQPYRPGERRRAKVKNRNYWRFPLEMAAARRGWPGRVRSRLANGFPETDGSARAPCSAVHTEIRPGRHRLCRLDESYLEGGTQ